MGFLWVYMWGVAGCSRDYSMASCYDGLYFKMPSHYIRLMLTWCFKCFIALVRTLLWNSCWNCGKTQHMWCVVFKLKGLKWVIMRVSWFWAETLCASGSFSLSHFAYLSLLKKKIKKPIEATSSFSLGLGNTCFTRPEVVGSETQRDSCRCTMKDLI